ncbi:unnamed protein product, partial [Anisakis simplex]|uniref:Nuclear transcription factor Y subunit n=1 Tax=Anisakis simplex TaxID=6269 RepID=A0A0M3JLB6_ANISI
MSKKARKKTYQEQTYESVIGVVPTKDETYRGCYRRYSDRKKDAERKERERLWAIGRDVIFNDPLRLDPPRLPRGIYPPDHGGIPSRPDPDMPQGPFFPQPRNPFLPPEIDPFPAVPPLLPSAHPPRNPLDPFSGSELLSSRPRRPGGLPRRYGDPDSS